MSSGLSFAVTWVTAFLALYLAQYMQLSVQRRGCHNDSSATALAASSSTQCVQPCRLGTLPLSKGFPDQAVRVLFRLTRPTASARFDCKQAILTGLQSYRLTVGPCTFMYLCLAILASAAGLGPTSLTAAGTHCAQNGSMIKIWKARGYLRSYEFWHRNG